MNFWQIYGQKTQIAECAGMPVNHLYEILARRRGVSKEKALALAAASEKVLGYPIPWAEWLFNKSSKHPAFEGEPIPNNDCICDEINSRNCPIHQ